jgi:hypothetical protein
VRDFYRYQIVFIIYTMSDGVDTGNATQTKLQPNDLVSANEIAIGEKIQKIPHYNRYFLPVIKSCLINIRKIDNMVLSKCAVVKHSDDLGHILMTTPQISNLDFFSFITAAQSDREKKRMFIHYIESYQYLLNSIEKLIESKIVHFGIDDDAIVYNKITTEPQIMDFSQSIVIDELNNEEDLKYFFKYKPDYPIWPLEVHIISFILNKTNNTLTENDAERICNDYINNNDTILQMVGSSFRESCLQQTRKYIGVNRINTIYNLIKSYTTWDNYALSILFLKTFNYIFKDERSLVDNKFIKLLIMNINPVFENRLSVLETREKLHELFYTDSDNLTMFIESTKYI